MVFTNVMTPRQARAARASLRLSVEALARASGVSGSSIRRIESGDTTLDTLERLQSHFETTGLRFRFGEWQCVCWKEAG